MIEKVLSTIKGVYKGGLFHIFGSNVIANVFALLSSMLVIRFLPKDLYGNYVDAHNLYSYLTVFIGFGLSGAIIQFCSENISEQKKNQIYRYSIIYGMGINVLLSLIVVLLAFFKMYSGDVEASRFLFMMSFYPFLIYIVNCFQSILRVQGQNKAFATVNIVSAATILFGNLLFTYIWNIYGLIVSTYFSQGICCIVVFVIAKKKKLFDLSVLKSKPLSKDRKRELKRYGFVTSITNFTSNALLLLDVTCLGLILSDSEILADYHVATVLPNACLFIPSGLIIYYYPKMVKSYSEGWQSFKKYILNISKVFLGFATITGIGIFVFAPLMIQIVYGEKYLTCVPIVRVLAINYFICAFLRKLLGNAIAVLKKYEINLIHTIISGVLNIILNLTFILMLGSIGAAIATLCVTAFVVVLEIMYFISFDKKQEKMKKIVN